MWVPPHCTFFMLSSFCAFILDQWRTKKGQEGDRRWRRVCKISWLFYFSSLLSVFFTTCGVSPTERARTWNKAGNERVKWKHGYGRVTTKRRRDRKVWEEEMEINTGRLWGRGAEVGGRQTEPEKRGVVTEGETGQKMDTVWQYGTGREGGGGEQGESGTREAGWEESTL